MKQLQLNGWHVVFDSNDTSAKTVVINTCGFIADAKEESVDTIMQFVEAKQKGAIDRILVMGCLSQRYREDLLKEIPEVDGFYGVNELPQIVKDLESSFNGSKQEHRLLTTPNHYAYLKVSEGCSWGCGYCAIPLIRGKHVSRPIESLVEETRLLAAMGVKELLIIAQDTTYYGLDLYGKRRLSDLLNRLSLISGIEWIRLHYAYPAQFPIDLIDTIRDNPKICKYLDIPFQHISDNMLRTMRRGIDKAETLALIDGLRGKVPNLAIRTTFLVGHPGETEADFDELLDFVRSYRFERAGVFTYSEEEGTHSAHKYPDTIPLEEKERRAEVLMDAQREVLHTHNMGRIGNTYRVIIDRVEGEYLAGRTEFDSPEVDTEVFVERAGAGNANPGDFVDVRVTSADEYDLYGILV